MAFSALDSCIMPSKAFKTTMSKMSTGSKNSMGSCPKQATTKLTAAASSRMTIITSLNWAKNRCRLVFFFASFRRFSPCWERRSAAREELRPSVGDVPRLCKRDFSESEWGVNVYQSSLCSVCPIIGMEGFPVTGQMGACVAFLPIPLDLSPKKTGGAPGSHTLVV